MGFLKIWLFDHIINRWMPNKRGIWNRLFFLTLGVGAVLVAALLIRSGSQEKIWEKEALRALEPQWADSMYVEWTELSGEDRAKTEQLLGQAEYYRSSAGHSSKSGDLLHLKLSEKDREMTLIVYQNGDMLAYGEKELVTHWYRADPAIYRHLHAVWNRDVK